MKIAYVFFMILAAALIGPAAGFNISQTADENTLLVDGHFFGVLSYDVDDMGYITLILEPLELDDTAFYPPEEDLANDPRIGPNETFLYSSILSLDPAICSTRSSITSRLRQGSASLRNPIASSRL